MSSHAASSDDRSFAERFDLSGAAAVVVGALALALTLIVLALCLATFITAKGTTDGLSDLADKLITGMLGMLAATRLGRPTTEPQPVTLTDQPVTTREVGGGAGIGPATPAPDSEI